MGVASLSSCVAGEEQRNARQVVDDDLVLSVARHRPRIALKDRLLLTMCLLKPLVAVAVAYCDAHTCLRIKRGTVAICLRCGGNARRMMDDEDDWG